MKKIILVACFSSIFHILHAQVLGYQGKRTVVEVQGMLPLFGLDIPNDVYPIYVKVHAEYALQRKRSVSLEYRQLNVSNSKGDFSHTGIVAMYGFYRKNWSLAPYGKYFNMGLGYNILNSKLINTTEPSPPTLNFFSAHLTWGRRTVFAKRFTFNYGFETGLALNGDIDAIGISLLTLFNMNLGVGVMF